MTLNKFFNNFHICIFNDWDHNPNSADNSRDYKYVYSDNIYEDYPYLTKHGIEVFQNGEVQNSALVMSSGGGTDIHDTAALIDNNILLICCANSVFCLTLPELNLLWQTKADPATCFAIFKYQNDYIVHGELEISRLDKNGRIIWEFTGTDIFTTPTGEDDFRIIDSIIYATNWEYITFQINADTGQAIASGKLPSR